MVGLEQVTIVFVLQDENVGSDVDIWVGQFFQSTVE
jgi:hypothetical protein